MNYVSSFQCLLCRIFKGLLSLELPQKVCIKKALRGGLDYGVFSPILDPEYVAKKVIRAIEKNKSFKGIPFGFHFIRFWQAILPTRVFDYFFGHVFGIYHAMDQFTGRQPANKE